MLGIEDPVTAIQVDIGIALRGFQLESEKRDSDEGISAEDLYQQLKGLGAA